MPLVHQLQGGQSGRFRFRGTAMPKDVNVNSVRRPVSLQVFSSVAFGTPYRSSVPAGRNGPSLRPSRTPHSPWHGRAVHPAAEPSQSHGSWRRSSAGCRAAFPPIPARSNASLLSLAFMKTIPPRARSAPFVPLCLEVPDLLEIQDRRFAFSDDCRALTLLGRQYHRSHYC